jgi:hypothetical protein
LRVAVTVDRVFSEEKKDHQVYSLPSTINSPSAPLSLVTYILPNPSFAIATGRKHCVVEQCSSSGLHNISVQAADELFAGAFGPYPLAVFVNGTSMTLYPEDGLRFQEPWKVIYMLVKFLLNAASSGAECAGSARRAGILFVMHVSSLKVALGSRTNWSPIENLRSVMVSGTATV